jgi:AMMECR1 domain-containing protein
MGWNETQMLEAVCRKANLPGDSWRDASIRLLVFESTCFAESDPPAASAGPTAG